MLCMSRAWAFEDVEDAADDNLILMYGWSRGKNPYRVSRSSCFPSLVSPVGVFLLNRMAGLRVGGASS